MIVHSYSKTTVSSFEFHILHPFIANHTYYITESPINQGVALYIIKSEIKCSPSYRAKRTSRGVAALHELLAVLFTFRASGTLSSKNAPPSVDKGAFFCWCGWWIRDQNFASLVWRIVFLFRYFQTNIQFSWCSLRHHTPTNTKSTRLGAFCVVSNPKF